MPLSRFHPAVSAWFSQAFVAPTACQAEAWQAIKAGENVLIAAPTGSGKTLAAFLAAIDELIHEGEVWGLPDETRVLYISPLKALSNDIHKNLEAPLEGIHSKLFECGATRVAIRSMVRTGDTPAGERAAMMRVPPHILVTTPESAYLMLTSERGRRMLGTVRTVIVDEIHAVVGSKRGSHLALSLERLARLVGRKLSRVGLSATQNPIEEVARFLTGGADCRLIDTGHRRRLDLAIELPDSPLEAVLSGEAAKDYYERLAALIERHRTTLIFVNTRRLSERLARALSDRVGEDNIMSHHGSLSREQRLSAEDRLKTGRLKALVATASLELGIDIGDVDLVCQWGSTGSIATFLQRIGRSGHSSGGLPKGRLFPTSRDDLIECIALLDAVRRGELDRLEMPEQPLDVLAQQIVAMVAAEDFAEDELYQLVGRAWPYRNLARRDFDAVVRMLAEGFSTRRGPRGAYLHRDGIHRRLRARKGARLTALTCGGAIPDNAEYRVIVEPTGEVIGTVDEDFAIESMAGDIFQLGNASWKLLRLEVGTLRVEDAQHQPPTIPFWMGEAPGRTFELSRAVSRLREEIEARLFPSHPLPLGEGRGVGTLDLTAARIFLEQDLGLSPATAEQAVGYLAVAKRTLGILPTLNAIVFERFFDESGGMQFIIHAPYGSRVNRGWGLALRKRFCRTFNFELQAAATENAILLSLGTSQSFALEEVARYLTAGTVRDILVQALLAAPMFAVRWRWNAVCALALKRFQGGRKTPPYLLRMQAEDLVTCVFPDQLACQENIVGDREIPDHPLVRQTVNDCLTEAMDIERLESVIHGIEIGTIRVVCRDVVEPSPLAAEIVNSRVYSFLDGVPLEERRTRAVAGRRWLDPSEAQDLGRLDPAAIVRVQEEVRPHANTAEELHDVLQTVGFLGRFEAEPAWPEFFQELVQQHRAAELRLANGRSLWMAAERLPQFWSVYPEINEGHRAHKELDSCAILSPPTILRKLPVEFAEQAWTPEDALREILRGRLSCSGPVTAEDLASALNLPTARVEQALYALQAEGFVLRGRFNERTKVKALSPHPGPMLPGCPARHPADALRATKSAPGGFVPKGEGGKDSAPTEADAPVEWCERRLLARIHHYTLHRLRQEIEPVAAADFMRFLFRWQHLHPDAWMQGPQALAAVLGQLEGFEAAAVAWESDLLPARITEYDPAWLDSLCLSGKIVWSRLSSGQAINSGTGPVKATPLALIGRRHLTFWREFAGPADPSELSATARHVAETLAARGALFFEELADTAGLLKTQLEMALAELVARGFVASDSYMGLRALLIPEQKKQRTRGLPFGMEEAGRWTLVRPLAMAPAVPMRTPADDEARRSAVEHIAGILLQRYGVVFRALFARESLLPAWQDLLRVYRRLEAREEIRGGRFVAGQFGEQYALPQAVEALRAVRKQKDDDTLITLSAADPLNLMGVVLPGGKIPAVAGHRVLYRGGLPLAVWAGKEAQFLAAVDKAQEWEIRSRLARRNVPPQLRAYLSST